VKLQRFGDLAVLVSETSDPIRIARSLNETRPKGLLEAVPAYDAIGLYFRDFPDLEYVEEIVRGALQPSAGPASKTVEIPCTYDGEDLAEAASLLSMSTDELIDLHAGRDYRCYALGFSPGFAYLGYLDDRLILPRRSQPRVRVPADSVAIAGRQTSVYPEATPGGWWLIGMTDVKLVDLEAQFFAIEAGDTVRFVPA
jgi:KipI family sensor histidine kinase inhibitor